MNTQSFYEDAIKIWNTIEASENGMLGGLGNSSIPLIDIETSKRFIELPCIYSKLGLDDKISRAADCGAGIGRITKNLLSKYCSSIDLIEPCEHFVKELQFGDYNASLRSQKKLGKVFQIGLENWHPQEKHYNIIWCQWCLDQLQDDDLIEFLKRAKKALISESTGVIFVKENYTKADTNYFDENYSSFVRTRENLESIFEKAGLNVIKSHIQPGFPDGLFPVILYALQ